MRSRINLVYEYNPNWIGGTYYVINLIKALDTLNDTKKPIIRVVCEKYTPLNLIEELNYPYLEYYYFKIKPSFFFEVINKIYRRFRYESLFKSNIPEELGPVYPLNGEYDLNTDLENKYFWIPDFQQKYLPQYFSKLQLKLRERAIQNLVRNKCNLVFSSQTAKNDFVKFYPQARNHTTVLRFVSILESEYKDLEIDILLKKFDLRSNYFICANQFWKHKNHRLVLEALQLVKKEISDIQIVFTGKEFDHRNPNYFNSLKDYVQSSSLENNVRFLGFIDRSEQLALMKESIAIIQPSFFEGWSTVVEDAKNLNKYLLVSDIPIHREQSTVNCEFFDLYDPTVLSGLLVKYSRNKPEIENIRYADNITRFADQLRALLVS